MYSDEKQQQQRRRRADRDPARRQRAIAGALDRSVELAVEDVVIGAARASHGDGADQE